LKLRKRRRELTKIWKKAQEVKMAGNFERIQIEPLDVDNYGEWRSQMVS
jgi:hypothetical protein